MAAGKLTDAAEPAGAAGTWPARCCFCARPAYDCAPLISAQGHWLQYHEACAAYSTAISCTGPIPSSIPAHKVQSEFARGRRATCSICKQPGATLNCVGVSASPPCQHMWHLPCAREAAGQNSSVVFAACQLQAACACHAHSIQKSLQEPAGLWFEGCGGWHHQQSVADPAYIASDPQRKLVQVEELENGSLASADVAAETAKGADDGMVRDRVGCRHDDALQNEAQPLEQRPSWRIPGHNWVTRGDIDGPPPCSPGDLLVLNTVIPHAYTGAYKLVTQRYMELHRQHPQKYPIVVAGSHSPSLSKKLEKYIKQHMQPKGALRSPDQLPKLLPVLARGERFAIPADDPRRALAAEPGALGWRNRASQALDGRRGVVPKDTVLGPYQSIQLLHTDYQDMVTDTQLARDQCLTPSQLAFCCEAFAADSSVGYGFFNPNTPQAKPLLSVWDLHEDYTLTFSAWAYGNTTALINDVAIDPLTEVKRGTRQLSHLPAGPNCIFLETLVFGWPHLFVVTSRDVQPQEEFLLEYGKSYWQTILKEKQRCRMSEAELQHLRAVHEAEQARLMKRTEDQSQLPSAVPPSSFSHGGGPTASQAPLEKTSSAAGSQNDTQGQGSHSVRAALPRSEQVEMTAAVGSPDNWRPVAQQHDVAKQHERQTALPAVEDCATFSGKPALSVQQAAQQVDMTFRSKERNQSSAIPGNSKQFVKDSDIPSRSWHRRARSRSRSRSRSRHRRGDSRSPPRTNSHQRLEPRGGRTVQHSARVARGHESAHEDDRRTFTSSRATGCKQRPGGYSEGSKRQQWLRPVHASSKAAFSSHTALIPRHAATGQHYLHRSSAGWQNSSPRAVSRPADGSGTPDLALRITDHDAMPLPASPRSGTPDQMVVQGPGQVPHNGRYRSAFGPPRSGTPDLEELAASGPGVHNTRHSDYPAGFAPKLYSAECLPSRPQAIPASRLQRQSGGLQSQFGQSDAYGQAAYRSCGGLFPTSATQADHQSMARLHTSISAHPYAVARAPLPEPQPVGRPGAARERQGAAASRKFVVKHQP